MTKNVDKEVQVTITYKEAAALANLLWHNVTCNVEAGRLRDKLLAKLPDDLSRRITAPSGVVRKLYDVQEGNSNDCGVVLSGADLFDIGEILVNETLPEWEEWDASMLETLDGETRIKAMLRSGVETEYGLARNILLGLAGWCTNPNHIVTHIKRA